MKFRSIIKVAAAVMAACGLMLTSCDKPSMQNEEVLALSIKTNTVASGKGQQFVNVKCSGDWTLALVAETGEVDWARLSATSGTGNKSNVILSYDVNAGEQDRSLKIYLDNGSKSVFCELKMIFPTLFPVSTTLLRKQTEKEPISLSLYLCLKSLPTIMTCPSISIRRPSMKQSSIVLPQR